MSLLWRGGNARLYIGRAWNHDLDRKVELCWHPCPAPQPFMAAYHCHIAIAWNWLPRLEWRPSDSCEYGGLGSLLTIPASRWTGRRRELVGISWPFRLSMKLTPPRS